MTPRLLRSRAGAVLLVSGCSAFHAQPLPSPVSRPPSPAREFTAGFARVDITPPPGVGLAGGGPESRRSTGYRTRLYASALVMSDSSGERIALVVVDLPHVSANLHRLASARLVERLGLGADRLILSATHTHSGPGHFYGERQYNLSTSRVTGYDPRVTDLLVSRIANSVEQAAAAAGPAVAAWGTTEVSGATWNRSLGPYCRNAETASGVACSSGDSTLAVERALFMLRVDRLSDGARDTVPLGSYSVFAMHGTAIPSLNTLLDGDVHVRVARLLAAHADRPGRATVHLFANGAEGDVAPRVTREHCELPRPGLFDVVPMPRGPGELVDFVGTGPTRARRCVDRAVAEAERVAAVIAGPALTLYDGLRPRLARISSIRRAFTTEWLPGHDGVCGSAEVGSSTAAGARGFETRVRDWRWLFWPILPLGIEEGGSAIDHGASGCQAPKLGLLKPLQSLVIVGEHGFPEVAQLAVVRLDSLLLGAVPAEVTTTAGRRMRARMMQAARDAGSPAGGAVLIGLANGFLNYVTTPEEYGAQHYEGGSVLYGAGSAGLLERRLGELAGILSFSGSQSSPPVEVGPIVAYPGRARTVMPLPGPQPAGPIEGPIDLTCHGGRLSASWLDLPPGRLLPRESPWVVLERVTDGLTWTRIAADGDGSLELTVVRSRGKSGFEWRAERRATEPGRYRLVRVADSVSAERASVPMACP